MKRTIQMVAGLLFILALGLVNPFTMGDADAHEGNVTCGNPGYMYLINSDPHDAVFHLPNGTVLVTGGTSQQRPVQAGTYTIDWTDHFHQDARPLPTTCGTVQTTTMTTTVPPTTTTVLTHPCGNGSAPPVNVPINEPCPGASTPITPAPPTTEALPSPPTTPSTSAPAVSEPPTSGPSQSIPSNTTPKANHTPSTSLPATGSSLWKKIVAIGVFILLVGIVGVLVVRDAEKDGGVKL